MKIKAKMGRTARKTFRHGDLRRALLEAAVDLAREGGPEAVVLREATRRAGVVPNAAYRHFTNHGDLLRAVKAAALSSLAMAIEEELAAIPRSRRAADHARAMLRAVGNGYLKFALTEKGLFRTTFLASQYGEGETDVANTGNSGLNPFQLLGSALDKMVEAGVLAKERRPGAEFLAWSAVHGMAFLAIEGPLQRVSAKEIQALTDRLLEMVERGMEMKR